MLLNRDDIKRVRSRCIKFNIQVAAYKLADYSILNFQKFVHRSNRQETQEYTREVA